MKRDPMTAQLSLFAPRTSAPSQCPRLPGPLCLDAGRLGACPGAVACEGWAAPRPGATPTRQAPTLAYVVAQANAELGEDADALALVNRALELAAPGRTCGACGCSEADRPITLYEHAPLAGQYRCWACARDVLCV